MKKKALLSKILLILTIFIIGGTIYSKTNSLKNKKNIIAVNDNSISSIVLDKRTVELEEGNSTKLNVTVTPSSESANIIWISNNKSIATVDKTGTVTAIKEGTAYIIATAKNNYSIRGICQVTVMKPATGKDEIEADKNEDLDSSNESTSTTGDDGSSSTTTATSSNPRVVQFLKILEKMSQTVQNDYKNGTAWKYYNGGNSGSFAIAVKKHNRKTNCAKFVSWAVIEMGILKPGQSFYKKKGNSISWSSDTKKRMQKNFKTINAGKKRAKTLIKNGTLQPGDIVLWNTQHTDVYAGNNKFYDAGRRGSINGCYYNKNKPHCQFKSFGPGYNKDLYNYKVWKILRLK